MSAGVKNERMEAFVRSLELKGPFPPWYEAYFQCFNAGNYYEAHDVLEHLWLQCRDSNALFYKGLIQLAGAFVHLQKQFRRPDHPKDGARLRPAFRLFELGLSNIRPFGPAHMGLDVAAFSGDCHRFARTIEESEFLINPWNPKMLPQVVLSRPTPV